MLLIPRWHQTFTQSTTKIIKSKKIPRSCSAKPSRAGVVVESRGGNAAPRCPTTACLSNANNCSVCGGGGGGGGQVLSTVDPGRYPEPGMYPACFPEPRSRTIVRVPRPGPIPARLQATGGKRLNIILVCERGATEPEQVFGYPDYRKARLGPVGAL